MMTVREAWTHARDQLIAAGVTESAALDAQVMLVEILGAHDRAYLFAHDRDILTDEQAAQYAAWVARRQAGEPVAYILGYKHWYDREIYVTPDVLIPRPETELLLEMTLTVCDTRPDAVVADVCTGSGAIAVTLAANAPQAVVYASDISPAALAVARENARRAGVDVTFFEGDLLKPFMQNNIFADILVSNPPYIQHDDMLKLPVSTHEPHLALDGGADGLEAIQQLLMGARSVCHPNAVIIIEMGADQGAAVLALAEHYLSPCLAEVLPDYAGLDRFLRVQLYSL